MKKKLIILVLLGGIISIIIYFYTKSDELTIVNIGDSISVGLTPYDIEGYSYNSYLKEYYEHKHRLKNYIYEFSRPHITIKELIYEIKENKTITIKDETLEIKRAINEADILIISLGMDELKNIKITSKVRTEFKEDYEELLSMIKMLNHNQVIVLGLYPTKEHDALTIAKINAIINDIAKINNFTYLDISSISNSPTNFFPNDNYYLNYQGSEEIYRKILNIIK